MADILLATDPDGDRVGVAIYDNNEIKTDDADEIDAWLTDVVSDKKEFDRLS